MKKILIFLTGILFFQLSYGQDETDALRYSYLTPGGDARLQSIGGAGVSLGGDASMMNTNPAAIGLFKNSEISITPGLKLSSADGRYLGQNETDSKSQFTIPQIGLVFAKNSSSSRNSNSRWRNVTMGIGLNRLADFNKKISYSGMNDNSSYTDNYLMDINGSNITNTSNFDDFKSAFPSDYAYGMGLSYSTDLFIPISDNDGNFDYWQSLPGEVLADKKSLLQTKTLQSKGGIDEFNFSVAGNYDDRLMLGIGLYIPSISYRRVTSFRETNPDDQNALMDYFEEQNSLHTDGTGINGKLGLIYIVNPQWRLGLAFHSPTLYSMHDVYSTNVTTNSTDIGLSSLSTQDVTGGYPGEYDYTMTTPMRVMGGLSYIFGTQPGAGQKGFLSLDYEFVNYGATRFHFDKSGSSSSDKTYEQNLNNSIRSMYQGGSNIRFGGELKFDMLSARAGIMYMGSPYKDSQIKGDQMRYSLGVGFRTGGFYIDASYIYTDGGSYPDQPYTVYDNDLGIHSPKPADIKEKDSRILLTFGFSM